MSKFKVIGNSVPRIDGIPKVTGEAVYLDDLFTEGVWVGGTVRSTVPYGRIVAIHKKPDFDWSSVVVVLPEDIPGSHFVQMVRKDYPVFAEEKVHFATQAVALVAAPSPDVLKKALRSIEVEIEPLEPVLTIEDSLAQKSVIWGDDNVLDEYFVNCGNADDGFSEADLVIEETYVTGLQEQMYLETQGVQARPLPNGTMEICGSLQCPYYVLGGVAAVLDLPHDKVRVKLVEVGGAFGGKEDYPTVLAIHAALLATKANRPVRIIYDRSEDMLSTPKRHPSKVIHKIGVKRDGTITAVDIDLILDGGAYTTMSRVVLQRSVLHTTGAYNIPNARIRGRAVATNTPPTGAFRGFGAPQAIFPMERQMDRIAQELDMSPLEVRMKNLMEPGDSFPYKQVMQEGLGARDVLTRVAKTSDYEHKHREFAKAAPSAKRKGMGISLALHGGGFTGAGEDNMNTTVRILFKDGGFEVLTSSVDMGQGSSTVLSMIAAESLGVPIERVTHPFADTFETPNSGPTVASRSTMFIGKVVDEGCQALIAELKDYLGQAKDCPASDILYSQGFFVAPDRTYPIAELCDAYAKEHGELSIVRTQSRPAVSSWDDEKFEGDAYKGYAWIAQAVEVEVDTDTYEITPTECFIVAETGRTINPVLASGQLEGGLLQGFGWAHIEDMELLKDGAYSAAHMNAYLVPTTMDSPAWHVEMLELPCQAGPFGAKGIGELPANGGAPAFLAAVENATGVFGKELPLTGERLFTLMEDQNRGGKK